MAAEVLRVKNLTKQPFTPLDASPLNPEETIESSRGLYLTQATRVVVIQPTRLFNGLEGYVGRPSSIETTKGFSFGDKVHDTKRVITSQEGEPLIEATYLGHWSRTYLDSIEAVRREFGKTDYATAIEHGEAASNAFIAGPGIFAQFNWPEHPNLYDVPNTPAHSFEGAGMFVVTLTKTQVGSQRMLADYGLATWAADGLLRMVSAHQSSPGTEVNKQNAPLILESIARISLYFKDLPQKTVFPVENIYGMRLPMNASDLDTNITPQELAWREARKRYSGPEVEEEMKKWLGVIKGLRGFNSKYLPNDPRISPR